MRPKRVSFHTLGCKLNFSETSTIARELSENGFVRSQKGEAADVCIINTCSVTEQANKKSRNLIRRLITANPDAIIAVTGCYAQLKPEEISAIEGVDIILGNEGKGELTRKVAELAAKGKSGNPALVYGCGSGEVSSFFASFSGGDRSRAFLKVQDGCDYKCSYCTIPYARGASRNIPIDSITGQARKIALSGQKEIVITGINTGDFGRSSGETFPELLTALGKVEGIERYRISSIEPNLLTDGIIELCSKNPKFMPHFHIPLQSGSDRVLGLMRRRYTTSLFEERVEAVRRAIPNAFIGIDVITGFPGETNDDFRTTYAFLEDLGPSFLHIFPYSERPGTPAVQLEGKVPASVSSARAAELKTLSDKLHYRFAARHEGNTAKVLFESNVRGGLMTGFTENYIKVSAPYRRECINKICEVQLGSADPDGKIEATIQQIL